MTCLDKDIEIDATLSKILTQYRESPNLIALIREGLGQNIDWINSTCELPEKHDILTAVGDQLTNVGKRLGWPRCHCVCTAAFPVFAWDCAPTNPNVTYATLCDESGVWDDCQDFEVSDLCITDDETYRGYLIARSIQVLQDYSIDSLKAAARAIWGETANAYSLNEARVCVSPGRVLTATENRELQLAFRVLPIAPGIQPFLDTSTSPVFGLGEGWADMCDGVWSCPEPFDAYNC